MLAIRYSATHHKYLLHRNTVTTEAKPIFILINGVNIIMATGNHRNRDMTSRTNQALKEPWKPLTMATWVWLTHTTVLCTTHVPMTWRTATIFTIYSTAFFMGPFFVLRTNKALISCKVVLPSSYIIMHYMLRAQLFLQPQLVSRRERTLPQL